MSKKEADKEGKVRAKAAEMATRTELERKKERRLKSKNYCYQLSQKTLLLSWLAMG